MRERNKPNISLGQYNSGLHSPKRLEALDHTPDSALQDGFTYSLRGGVISVIPSWFQTAKKCHKSFSTGSLALCWTSKLTNLAFPLRLSVWVGRALRCGVPGPVQISEDPGLTQPRCKKRSMTQCHPERQLTSYSFSQISWNAAKILNTTVSKLKKNTAYKASRFNRIILIWNSTNMWSLRIYFYMPVHICHDRHIVHLLWIILHFASKTKNVFKVFFIPLLKIDIVM